jgi:thiamine pyrophosphokinase
MAVCYIAGAAPEAVEISPAPGDFLIAADGGLDHLTRWGLTPDLLIGDLDSLQATSAPEALPRKQFPREKDDTDLALALEEAFARADKNIIVTGAWGGRADHSLGSLQLLAKAARRGFFAQMLCVGLIATAITGGSTLHLKGHGTVSVFAHGGTASGVAIRGLEYSLEHAVLYDDTPLGISNALHGEGQITLEHGMLLIFYQEEIQCDIA